MREIRLFGVGVNLGKKPVKVAFKGGGKRGKIGSFSSASRLRLRSALLSLRLPGGVRVGVTLTLPWRLDDWSSAMGAFRDVMHRFRVAWLRRFPDCGCVYRVELQVRGAPHVHLVAWHFPGTLDDLPGVYFTLWLNALQGLRGGSMSSFARHGVSLDKEMNLIASIRYLCDHGSKRKQAQLGYKGKQWGILGLANLSRWQGFPLEVSDHEFLLLSRFLRRLSRFRVRADCVFGCKLSRLKHINRIVYCSDDIIIRFLQKNADSPLPSHESFDSILSSADV